MASPVGHIPAYGSEHLFVATPNFEDMRDGGIHDTDFSYFDTTMESTGDSFLLDGTDYAQASWDFPSKDRPELMVDPSLTSNAIVYRTPGLDFRGSNLLSPPQELTPPPSAIDSKSSAPWAARKGTSRGSESDQHTSTLDAPTKSNAGFTSRHGQITPPMSSKSPDSEGQAEAANSAASASKRGRKPSTKMTIKTEGVSFPPTTTTPAYVKPSRKARKGKADIVTEQEEEPQTEEPQTEEAQAKRARFLERNRQAAFTCRQRKKQWAKDLEDRHRTLERENQNLKLVLGSLKQEYHYLRQQVVSHTTCECSGAREYIQRSSRVLAGEPGSNVTEHRLPDDPSTGLNPAAMPPIGLEQALRTSIAQFESEHGVNPPRSADSLDFVHEGSELDGMTL